VIVSELAEIKYNLKTSSVNLVVIIVHVLRMCYIERIRSLVKPLCFVCGVLCLLKYYQVTIFLWRKQFIVLFPSLCFLAVLFNHLFINQSLASESIAQKCEHPGF
jgi:hypothetical protein